MDLGTGAPPVSEADGSQDRPGLSKRHPRWSAFCRLILICWLAEVGQSEHAARISDPIAPAIEPAASGERLKSQEVRSA
jgi:hypothetical protein